VANPSRKDEAVLGVDPGLGTTGWGVIRVKDGNVRYVDSGRIKTYATQPIGQRLDKIYRELQDVIQRHTITTCAVEAGFVGRSPLSSLQLGQARAAAVLAASTRNIPVECLSPREVKMAITGKGSAAKGQVGYVVGKMLGLAFDEGEEDISDALAVALCHVSHSRSPFKLKAAR